MFSSFECEMSTWSSIFVVISGIDLNDDPVLNAIENFSNHVSVLKIIEARDSYDCVSFRLVTIEDIL